MPIPEAGTAIPSGPEPVFSQSGTSYTLLLDFDTSEKEVLRALKSFWSVMEPR